MPRSRRRGKNATGGTEDDKVKCPSEVVNEVNRIAVVLLKELEEPDASTDRLLTTIAILRELLNTIHVMDWDPSFEELIDSLKNCLLLEFTLGERLASERRTEGVDEIRKVGVGRSASTYSKNCIAIVLGSISILEKLTLVFSDQDVANFFLRLMSKNSAHSHAFLDIIRINEYRYFYSQMEPTFEVFLGLIKLLIEKCKPSLLTADTKMTAARRVPYTSFASAIGSLIEGTMHQVLMILEDSEVQPERLKQMNFGKLKMASLFDLLATVAEVAPFHRLNPAAYDMMFRFAIKQVQIKPPIISRNYLTRILIVVLSSDSSSTTENALVLYSLPKIGKFQVNLLISQSFNYALYWLINSHDNMSSSEFVHRTAMTGLELKVISTFASKHYPALKNESLHCMELAVNVLKVGLSLECAFRAQQDKSNRSMEDNAKILDKVMEPAFQAASYIQTILVCLQEGYETTGQPNSQDTDLEVEEDVSDIEPCVPAEKEKPEDVLYRLEFVRLFVEFLDLTAELMTSRCERVAEVIVECFTGIGPLVYNLLDERYKRFCVISILGYARDSRMSIRTRSGRAVARFLELPDLVKNYDGFLMDAFEVIELNLKQRTTAANHSAYAWAIGNLATTLVKYFPGVLPVGAGLKFMMRIYNIGVTLANSETKSRYNGHRVLGGLLRWAPVEFMETPEFRMMLRHSITLMGKQVGRGSDFKARWNACYGLGSLIQNKILVEKFGPKLVHPLRETLMRGLHRSENFKEKTNCVKALCSFTKRDQYGDQNQFLRIFEMFFKCLETPEIKVPCLYKLVNKFVDDVGLGIFHFISLMTNDDNNILESLILENTEKLRSIFERLSGDPERSWIIKKARDNIQLQATFSPNSVAQKRLRWAFKISSQYS